MKRLSGMSGEHHIRLCFLIIEIPMRCISDNDRKCARTILMNICFFLLVKSVALAGRCYHHPARFRHRNMYLIGKDHLPLGKL